MTHEIEKYVLYDVLKRDAADASGQLGQWPVIEAELPDYVIAILESDARRHGCDFETMFSALLHMHAKRVLSLA